MSLVFMLTLIVKYNMIWATFFRDAGDVLAGCQSPRGRTGKFHLSQHPVRPPGACSKQVIDSLQSCNSIV